MPPFSSEPARNPTPRFTLVSEFAAVDVELNVTGNGPRLLIVDRRSGREIALDPLELASLTLCSHRDLEWLVDPARMAGSREAEER